MAAPFLDSNVVLYALAEADVRRPAARAILAQEFVVSAQTLNECASVASRKFHLPWDDIAEFLGGLADNAQRFVLLDAALNASAIGLAERYKLAFYDALIIAAALHADCDTLYSEDMQDGLVIERRLTIRNPFADLRLA